MLLFFIKNVVHEIKILILNLKCYSDVASNESKLNMIPPISESVL